MTRPEHRVVGIRIWYYFMAQRYEKNDDVYRPCSRLPNDVCVCVWYTKTLCTNSNIRRQVLTSYPKACRPPLGHGNLEFSTVKP